MSPAVPDAALDALLAGLRRISPMPEDERTSTVLHRAYADLVGKVLAHEPRDPRAIAPLLASFGPGECRGTYGKVCLWVRAFEDDVAGAALIAAAERGSPAARRWAVRTIGEMAYLPGEAAVRAALTDDVLAVRKAADLAVRMIEASKPEPDEDDRPDPLFDGIAQA